MVKTLNNQTVTSSPNGTKKQRKKQARQEAKAMLKLEQAKKNEQKAAKKATKAQAQLEAYRMQIHKIEARLAEIRTPHYDEPARDTQGASQMDRKSPRAVLRITLLCRIPRTTRPLLHLRGRTTQILRMNGKRTPLAMAKLLFQNIQTRNLPLLRRANREG